jgi:tRNA1Val (adenine37-N6)-methyltransferase
VSDDGGELTRDEILRGRLVVWQPRDGYRFAVDPLLLVDFVGREAQVADACDLGAGSGVIALGLALAFPEARVTAVELQPRLAELARRNVDENRLGARVSVVQADLADAAAARAALPGASFDLAASNPPFRPLGEGDANPAAEEAIARHEVRLALADVAREARRALRPGGRCAIVYPAERLTALLGTLDGEGLRPLRLRLVHARPGEPARRALVEARKGARGHLVVEPPLLLRDVDGEYSADARRALGEAAR